MLLAVLALAACDPEGGDDTATNPDDGHSGDTGGRRGEVVTPPMGRIAAYEATCGADGAYRGELRTTAETSGIARLSVWETGDAEGWNEEHDLVSVGSGTGGELLALTLAWGRRDAVTTGEGDHVGVTAFGCEPGGAFLRSTTLTYALRTTDAAGNLTDCVAFGHRPECVTTGTCGDAAGVVAQPDQLIGCRIE